MVTPPTAFYRVPKTIEKPGLCPLKVIRRKYKRTLVFIMSRAIQHNIKRMSVSVAFQLASEIIIQTNSGAHSIAGNKEDDPENSIGLLHFILGELEDPKSQIDSTVHDLTTGKERMSENHFGFLQSKCGKLHRHTDDFHIIIELVQDVVERI